MRMHHRIVVAGRRTTCYTPFFLSSRHVAAESVRREIRGEAQLGNAPHVLQVGRRQLLAIREHVVRQRVVQVLERIARLAALILVRARVRGLLVFALEPLPAGRVHDRDFDAQQLAVGLDDLARRHAHRALRRRPASRAPGPTGRCLRAYCGSASGNSAPRLCAPPGRCAPPPSPSRPWARSPRTAARRHRAAARSGISCAA